VFRRAKAKSLPTSLFLTEERSIFWQFQNNSPLWKRGIKGDFAFDFTRNTLEHV